jgi:hypothetical protein
MSPYKPVVIVLGPYTPPKPKKIAAAPKPKHAAPVAASDDHVYLRATPVDLSELGIPSIKSTPPAATAHPDVATDPNSLGAPLNPVGAYPPMIPRRPELNLRDDNTPSGMMPASVIPKPGETVP